MNNYYVGINYCPHHMSVGAILLNKENKVACHYYEKTIRTYPEKFYTLMHETVELGETLEDALHRGLEEEFSAKGEIVSYVGSLVVYGKMKESMVEKTVLYFVCNLTSVSKDRSTEGEENSSEIKWMDIDELIVIMKKQGEKHSPSADESKILIDVKKYFIKI